MELSVAIKAYLDSSNELKIIMAKVIAQFVSNGFASVYGRGKNISGRTQWHFEYEDFSIILSDYVREFDGKLLPVGLLSTVETDRESVEESLAFAKEVAESILSLVCLSTLTTIHDCSLIGYVDFSGRRAKSFSFPFNNISPMGPLTVLKETEFREIFKHYEASTEKRRIMRSLAWLRKGINEVHTLDEFIAYFTGLEILACLLRDRLKMKMRRPGEWKGIEQIFDALGVVSFRSVNAARNELLHGSRELNSTFVSEINSYVNPTRSALIMAIGELLGLEPLTTKHLTSKKVRRQRFPQSVAVEADFIIPAELSEEELILNFPQVIATVTSTKIEVGENGELTYQHQIDNKFLGPDGVRWENIAYETWGDPDSDVNKSSLTLNGTPLVSHTTHSG